MKVPTFIRQKFVGNDDFLTDQMQSFFEESNFQTQQNLSDDGFVIPARTTTDINYIADSANANSKPNGTIWYDSETEEFKGKINGVVKVFTLV